MAYRIHYSDYPGTAEGPPDPERWVGPPGPSGPAGAPGVPGPGAFMGPTSPPSPQVGQYWWNSADGNTYAWYDDGNSQQWVPAVANPGATSGGGMLPLSGGTMAGPLNYTATGGTVSRSLQSRMGERLSATDFGIICDGVTDQGAALNAALASMTPGTTLFIPGSVYTSVTIVVPAGGRLEMPPGAMVRPSGSSTLLVGTIAIIGAAALSPVVQCTNASLTNCWITRNGAPAAGSIGLQAFGQDSVFTRCRIYNHARPVQLGAPRAGGGLYYALNTAFDHCMFWNCTENYAYLLNSPETAFYDCRFGVNGATDPGANAYVMIDGDGNASDPSATNTVDFIRCQFNAGVSGSLLYGIELYQWNYGGLNLIDCYSGGAANAFLFVDPSCTRVLDCKIIGCQIAPLSASEVLLSDTGAKLTGLKMVGNYISGGPTSPAVAFYVHGVTAQIIGNNFGGPFALQVDSLTGGNVIGNTVNTLTVSGTFTGNAVIANNTAATFNQSATGTVNYNEPFGNYGNQLTLGKTGQSGRIDLRRGVDGVLVGWMGINGAAGGAMLDITNDGGSPQVRLNAGNVGGICMFMVNNVEVGRFDANGLGISKVTAAAVAPGAGFAKLAFVAGTTAGTGKLVAYCGTSTTPVTIVDNIGAGF